LFHFFQRTTELVGTRRRFIPAADSIEFVDYVVNLLACHQTADALKITVATAIKEDLPDDAIVIDGHINQLRAGTLGFVEEVGHNQ
jgi:hypothetical protein